MADDVPAPTPSDAAPARDETIEELHARGMARRRAVLGAEHVARASAKATAFDADFQDFITRAAWGELWNRDGLELETRHLIVLALMAALGREDEFAMHVRATENTGVTPEQIREILHVVAIYAGVPAANTAFKIAKRTLTDAGRLEGSDTE